jgi:hypothetical protein
VADPLLSMPVDIAGAPGSTVTVPINIDDANLVESLDLTIRYDTTRFDVATSGVRPGSLTAGATIFANVDDATGTIRVSMLPTHALSTSSGSLLEIDYHIREDAGPGSSLLDLQFAALNEGSLVLTWLAVPGEDPTDGRISIPGTVVNALQITPDLHIQQLLAFSDTPRGNAAVPAHPRADTVAVKGDGLAIVEDALSTADPNEWWGSARFKRLGNLVRSRSAMFPRRF